jgi:hypothetical protein
LIGLFLEILGFEIPACEGWRHGVVKWDI